MPPNPQQASPHLQLRVSQDNQGRSQAIRTYATYPFRLSPPLQLAPQDRKGLYLYLMNTSPGWFAGDSCTALVNLDPHTRLFLSDQAATKVYTMPGADQSAQLRYQVHLAKGAFLEWLPEPIILYQDACFHQTFDITIAEEAGLVMSEILIPGRLARGESYQFRAYWNRVVVKNIQGQVLFIDSNQIAGKNNPLVSSKLITSLPISGTLYLLPPTPLKLSLLRDKLHKLAKDNDQELRVGISALPNCQGLIVRFLATHASQIRHYTHQAVAILRALIDLPILPEIPK